jgi:hypothetical protein
LKLLSKEYVSIEGADIQLKMNGIKNTVIDDKLFLNEYGQTYLINGNYMHIVIGSNQKIQNYGITTLKLSNDLIIDNYLISNYKELNTIKSLYIFQTYYLFQDSRYATPSDEFIEKEGKRATYEHFGFNIYWTFVVDYITIGKAKIPKEVLLKAPAFTVKELDSGSVYVRLTEEEPDPYEFIIEYVDAYMAFYDYCEDWIKENTK